MAFFHSLQARFAIAAGTSRRLAVLFFIAYLTLDWLSYVHPVFPLGITPWNPGAGLSVAVLFLYGIGFAPVLALGALAAEYLVRGAPAPWPYLAVASSVIAGGYAAAAIALRRYDFDPRFTRARDVIVFLVVAALVSFGVALGYVGVFRLGGLIDASELISGLVRYWIGDFNGVLVFAPALLLLLRPATAVERLLSRESIAQAAAIALVFWIIFGIEATDEHKFFYLLFLPLIWVALRHGIAGTAVALALIQIGLIITVQSRGYATTAFIEFQFLMLALCITGLLLGATISQRKRAEQQLLDKQLELNRALQFAAAGEMTSALAHELNNPIAALTNYMRAAQLLLDARPPVSDPLREALDKAFREAQRAGDVVRRLRDLFRSGATQLAPESIAAIVDQVLISTAARAQRHRVRLRIEAMPDGIQVLVDALQIETVLHNLVNNAIDAFAHDVAAVGKRDNEIVIRAQAQGDRLLISVSDNGPGIGTDTGAKLFEPFNTSKQKGMGLGLAISRSIARAHDGDLILEHSGVGVTCFVLWLPLQGPVDE